MLDCTLFDAWAGGHHLMSLAFHVANTLLLYAVLRRMTGAVWRSAMVAALFALHPLHVESVAWIAERKDLLSGFFFLLTLWAYARYAQAKSRVSTLDAPHPALNLPPPALNPALASRLWTFDYSLALLFFALGLMSKPMVVTLPFVLLLLNYWPLHRFPLSTLNQRPSTSPLPRSPLSPQPSTLNSQSTLNRPSAIALAKDPVSQASTLDIRLSTPSPHSPPLPPSAAPAPPGRETSFPWPDIVLLCDHILWGARRQ